MKLFINHFDTSIFTNLFKDYSNIDFSLFIDSRPSKPEDLSSVNIIVLQEPNEYFGHHDWVINNKDMFSVILTWSDKVLRTCENSMFLPFGSPWVVDVTPHSEKKFELSHIQGSLLKTYGHLLRHETLNRKKEFTIPVDFHETFGVRYPVDEAIKSKIALFNKSQFAIAIENTSHNGYFTEKLTDLLMMKTIPIYCGCTSIGKHFNMKGIITFSNVDELIEKCNTLTDSYYNDHIQHVNENHTLVKNYLNYEGRIVNTILSIFKLNGIL